MTNQSPEPSSCEVIVLTALPVEFEAAIRHLEDMQECVHPSGTIYHQGTFAGAHRIWRVAVAEIGMGGTAAAVEAEKAIQFFHPQMALFVGVAGGLKDVRRGDVVVATKVYVYEAGKAGSHFEPRPDLGHSSYALEQRARAEAHGTEWLARLTGDIPDPAPQVRIGAIAAGEKVLSSKQSSLARLLTRTYGDALAIEMEGHGFLHAVRLNHVVLGLVIRGISDLVDDKREADASGMQAIAAHHAAAFAFQVLAKFTLSAPNHGHVKMPPVMLPPQAQTFVGQEGERRLFSSEKQPLMPPLSKHLRITLVFISLILVLIGAGSLGIYTISKWNTSLKADPSIGRTWHFQTSGTPDGLNGIAWCGSQFVAVGWFGTILTSPDGISWTSHSSGTSQIARGIACSGSQFVAVGGSGTIFTSPDGVTWTSLTSSTSQSLQAIAWSGSQFVAVGDSGTILTSPDGISWTSHSSGTSQSLQAIARCGSQFVAVGLNGTILTSPDDISWATHPSGTPQHLHGIACSGSQFVAVGDGGTILTSPNGISWTSRTSSTSPGLLGVASSGSQLVAVGQNGTILTSPDGISWATHSSGTPQELRGIACSGSQFVAVGDGGTILTSP